MAKKKRKKIRKRIIISTIVLVIIVVVVVIVVKKSRVQPIEVQTEKVQHREIIHKVAASGTIQSEKEVEISAYNSALIMEITLEEGDDVVVGQHLISLDRTRYEASVEEVQSRLKSAEAALVEAKAQKERAEKLYTDKHISSENLESVIARFQQAESSVEMSKANLKTAMDNLSKTTLLAPQSGTVTQILKEEGDMALGSGFQADVLMTIADLTKMEVVVEVNENDVVDVSIEDTTEIEIDAFQDTVFYGIVKEISQVAVVTGMGTQEQVTNYKVKIRMLEVPVGIRQGMSAIANIITDVKDDVLSIPIQSLTVRSSKPVKMTARGSKPPGGGPPREREIGSYSSKDEWEKPQMVEVVFVVSDTMVEGSEYSSKKHRVKGSKYAEQREVKVGLSSETHYEVISGLEEGEKIVTGSYKAISRELQNNSPIVKKEKRREWGNKKE
ncbi:MAG: efflux RND transporter periplasmic adaptor subunit [Candidatus Marinimicrobia bacterium]|nr:efflux RND transporter periplasmic adaptor subunit [Candidatus Neomarinimicrobiota bacterium]MBL7047536.1 efflux RND transporter periplasmic adaptor subunit [Candidatus Neomarinimicrobiota bacterium]